MTEDAALSEMFRFADVTLREFAAMTAANEDASFEAAYKRTWQLFELGHLKLVGEGGRLRARACITRTERRVVAKQNRPLSLFRRRTVLAAPWSGTEREQAARSIEQSAMVNVAAFETFANA